MIFRSIMILLIVARFIDPEIKVILHGCCFIHRLCTRLSKLRNVTTKSLKRFAIFLENGIS